MPEVRAWGRLTFRCSSPEVLAGRLARDLVKGLRPYRPAQPIKAKGPRKHNWPSRTGNHHEVLVTHETSNTFLLWRTSGTTPSLNPVFSFHVILSFSLEFISMLPGSTVSVPTSGPHLSLSNPMRTLGIQAMWSKKPAAGPHILARTC